jgi:maltose alpha-D-glucosyltransferase/alpha-amylase
MQEELGRYQERALTLPAPEAIAQGGLRGWIEAGEAGLPPAVAELLGLSDDAAAALGRRTGELHLALGKPTPDAAFQPEPLTAPDLQHLAGEMGGHAREAFQLLKEVFPRLPEDVVELASQALSLRRHVSARLERLPRLTPGGVKIRVHGDYHLGQVLRTGNDFVIIDFEGEPARPLADRRAKYCALRDVAGMLRSFGYAAQVALMTHVARRPGDLDRLVPWAQLWEQWVCSVFLHAYLRTVAGSELIPADRATLEGVLEGFLLDKVLYELRYELNNRPAWVRVPLAGLLSLRLDEKRPA